ncbi:hypothetical protein NEHOM01_0432 [Nematocida homosporus]|uniref:uncharacterized protein n=1 Tax=Nematocida homosporus TaxID=1912981 RepID=UPI00221ECB2C|nr:uncharacterized protein NEHOM01_0432 [Nematocida homosporus]KAI5184830.1 hypothetical protein NEHOM01_0432 [Nematocida homosporus]
MLGLDWKLVLMRLCCALVIIGAGLASVDGYLDTFSELIEDISPDFEIFTDIVEPAFGEEENQPSPQLIAALKAFEVIDGTSNYHLTKYVDLANTTAYCALTVKSKSMESTKSSCFITITLGLATQTPANQDPQSMGYVYVSTPPENWFFLGATTNKGTMVIKILLDLLQATPPLTIGIDWVDTISSVGDTQSASDHIPDNEKTLTLSINVNILDNYEDWMPIFKEIKRKCEASKSKDVLVFDDNGLLND